MNVNRYLAAVGTLSLCFSAALAWPAESSFEAELSAIQQEFDTANFLTTSKRERKSAFDALIEHVTAFNNKYPDRVEAVAWKGIVLSAYAGEVGAMSAMKYAKAAREALLEAERMNPVSLDGGVYASLGALYSKVPGGFIGFGDDELAAEYFAKALEVNPDNIDSNYFYGEFLIEQGNVAEAATVLNHALNAPAVVNRPVLDAGRRSEIRTLLASAQH
jgi:tetratricopeptide (TPR) repeat protein